jgi:hypothetical protein
MEWKPIETVPRDGSQVLLFTKTHGVTEARFSAGEWSEHHEYGRQYDGPVWVCGDDAWQIEVEEGPDGFHDGEATHWMPVMSPPVANAS